MRAGGGKVEFGEDELILVQETIPSVVDSKNAAYPTFWGTGASIRTITEMRPVTTRNPQYTMIVLAFENPRRPSSSLFSSLRSLIDFD